MAQKRKNKKHNAYVEKIPRVMHNHIRELDIKTFNEYKEWYRENHFSCSLNKGSHQRRKELSAAKAAMAKQLLTAEKKTEI